MKKHCPGCNRKTVVRAFTLWLSVAVLNLQPGKGQSVPLKAPVGTDWLKK